MVGAMGRHGGTRASLLRATLNCSPLHLGGLYAEVVTGCWAVRVSQGDRSQMDIHGGGGTSLGIPPMEVLGVIITPVDAVVP